MTFRKSFRPLKENSSILMEKGLEFIRASKFQEYVISALNKLGEYLANDRPCRI